MRRAGRSRTSRRRSLYAHGDGVGGLGREGRRRGGRACSSVLRQGGGLGRGHSGIDPSHDWRRRTNGCLRRRHFHGGGGRHAGSVGEGLRRGFGLRGHGGRWQRNGCASTQRGGLAGRSRRCPVRGCLPARASGHAQGSYGRSGDCGRGSARHGGGEGGDPLLGRGLVPLLAGLVVGPSTRREIGSATLAETPVGAVGVLAWRLCTLGVRRGDVSKLSGGDRPVGVDRTAAVPRNSGERPRATVLAGPPALPATGGAGVGAYSASGGIGTGLMRVDSPTGVKHRGRRGSQADQGRQHTVSRVQTQQQGHGHGIESPQQASVRDGHRLRTHVVVFRRCRALETAMQGEQPGAAPKRAPPYPVLCEAGFSCEVIRGHLRSALAQHVQSLGY